MALGEADVRIWSGVRKLRAKKEEAHRNSSGSRGQGQRPKDQDSGRYDDDSNDNFDGDVGGDVGDDGSSDGGGNGSNRF